MWTWERERRAVREEPLAQLGQMTLSGAVTGANLGGERRWLNLCAPGGFQWNPREGEQVLVLKLPDGGQSCILGVVGQETSLLPGQVKLTGGDCTLLLGDGLELNGEVRVNGERLEDIIRRIAADMMGG